MKNQVIKDLGEGDLQPLIKHLEFLLRYSWWDFPNYEAELQNDPEEGPLPEGYTYWDEFVEVEGNDDIAEYLEICGGAVGFSPMEMIVRYRKPFHPQSDPQIDPARVKADFARLQHQDETYLSVMVPGQDPSHRHGVTN